MDLVLVYFFFLLLNVFLTFKVVFWMLMIDLNVPFGFYCGDCFDRVVNLFHFRIYVRECPDGVKCLWQPLTSADLFDFIGGLLLLLLLLLLLFSKYPVRGQKLLGSPRSGSTALSYRNCIITPGWRLMRTWYRTCFHTLYDEKKRYVYSECILCVCEYAWVLVCIYVYIL